MKEQGLFADEIGALAAQFDRKAALADKADFQKLRNKTLELVNRK